MTMSNLYSLCAMFFFLNFEVITKNLPWRQIIVSIVINLKKKIFIKPFLINVHIFHF